MWILLSLISVLFLVVISHVVAKTAEHKEVGYSIVFLFSLFLTPLLGLLLSIASPITEEKPKPFRFHISERAANILLWCGLILIIIVFCGGFVYDLIY